MFVHRSCLKVLLEVALQAGEGARPDEDEPRVLREVERDRLEALGGRRSSVCKNALYNHDAAAECYRQFAYGACPQ